MRPCSASETKISNKNTQQSQKAKAPTNEKSKNFPEYNVDKTYRAFMSGLAFGAAVDVDADLSDCGHLHTLSLPLLCQA